MSWVQKSGCFGGYEVCNVYLFKLQIHYLGPELLLSTGFSFTFLKVVVSVQTIVKLFVLLIPQWFSHRVYSLFEFLFSAWVIRSSVFVQLDFFCYILSPHAPSAPSSLCSSDPATPRTDHPYTFVHISSCTTVFSFNHKPLWVHMVCPTLLLRCTSYLGLMSVPFWVVIPSTYL